MTATQSSRALRAAAILLVSGSLLPASAFAASDDNAGAPGVASAASRTIEIVMQDNYYEPEEVDIEAGETIRFVVRNDGGLVHAFNIGTTAMLMAYQSDMAMLVEHGVLKPESVDLEAAKSMLASMGGEGSLDDPNSILLQPGSSGEVVWTFPSDPEIALEFGCSMPGHYDAGMAGEFALSQ